MNYKFKRYLLDIVLGEESPTCHGFCFGIGGFLLGWDLVRADGWLRMELAGTSTDATAFLGFGRSVCFWRELVLLLWSGASATAFAATGIFGAAVDSAVVGAAGAGICCCSGQLGWCLLECRCCILHFFRVTCLEWLLGILKQFSFRRSGWVVKQEQVNYG